MILGLLLRTLLTVLALVTVTSFGNSANTNYPIYYVPMVGGVNFTLVGSGTLILPGTTNIIVAAGDIFYARFFGSNTWVVYNYSRANGTAVVPTQVIPTHNGAYWRLVSGPARRR